MDQLSAAAVPDFIRNVYKKNCFMEDFFRIRIDRISCGSATVSLMLDHDRHANHRDIVHGGVLMALADAVTGVTCASVGSQCVTVSITMNFLRNAPFRERIRVTSHIKHRGRTTIIISAEMFDEEDHLMAEILATMMTVGKFEEIPEQW